MRTIQESFDDSIYRHQHEIKMEDIPGLIAADLMEEFPGNHKLYVFEIERGYKLSVKFDTPEDEVLFRLKYRIK